MKYFDVFDLLNTAKRRTGLSNFGDPEFMENLEVFVKAVNEGQGIAADRWEQCREYFIRLLINRLFLTKDFEDHPEIFDEHLLSPVVILPQPRTGSTKLHRMLGASGSFQEILWWHMHMLARIPGKADGGKTERIQATKDFETWSLAMSPDMTKGHPLYAMTTEEEQIFHEMTFWSVRISLQFSAAPWHLRWLVENGVTQAYDFLYKQLQYVQWQHYPMADRPFLLKSPTNLGKEKHLTRLFGNKIKIICPHRNPINVICSIAEVANHYRKIFSDVPTEKIAHRFGHVTMKGFSSDAKANMAWRDANPDIEVFDLSFDDINKRPKKVLHEIYEFLEIPLSKEIESNIDNWEKDKTRNKYRKNIYTPEMFGLTETQILDAYAPYIERFNDYMEI